MKPLRGYPCSSRQSYAHTVPTHTEVPERTQLRGHMKLRRNTKGQIQGWRVKMKQTEVPRGCPSRSDAHLLPDHHTGQQPERNSDPISASNSLPKLTYQSQQTTVSQKISKEVFLDSVWCWSLQSPIWSECRPLVEFSNWISLCMLSLLSWCSLLKRFKTELKSCVCVCVSVCVRARVCVFMCA